MFVKEKKNNQQTKQTIKKTDKRQVVEEEAYGKSGIQQSIGEAVEYVWVFVQLPWKTKSKHTGWQLLLVMKRQGHSKHNSTANLLFHSYNNINYEKTFFFEVCLKISSDNPLLKD